MLHLNHNHQLDVLPEKWRNLVKQATVMKNEVAPMQAAQAALIAKRVALINLRLTMYRDQFKLKEVGDIFTALIFKVLKLNSKFYFEVIMLLILKMTSVSFYELCLNLIIFVILVMKYFA